MAKKDAAEPEQTAQQKIRKAYSAAGTRLREAHQEEFNQYQIEEARKLGIEWSPRPNALAKARAEMEALLAAHPELLDEFGQRLAAMEQNA